MEDFLFTFTAIMLGIVVTIQVARWLWTAPGEFVRLLSQGPSPKLTFVFIGMGMAVVALIILQSTGATLDQQLWSYLLVAGGSAGLSGILYHIFLSTKYQTVGYFFIIILKILLVIIPTVIITLITENLIGGFVYFFIMLLITYYSVYRIKTSSGNTGSSMTGTQTIDISTTKVLKYLISSLFQAVLGYFVSMVLSDFFG